MRRGREGGEGEREDGKRKRREREGGGREKEEGERGRRGEQDKTVEGR